MNRTYRVVWNASKGVWQAVAESCRLRGKTGAARSAVTSLVLSALVAGPAVAQVVLPTGGAVVSGSGSITPGVDSVTVTQSSARLALDWQSFSVGPQGTVRFVQPDSSAVALNRVLGSDVSLIQGSIQANGSIFLLNPNGVLFTSSAQVNVGGILASTLQMRLDDFAAGRYRLSGGTANAVINQGHITTMPSPGGFVAMVAGRVVNEGSISAEGGSVKMVAAGAVTLDLGGPLKLSVDRGAYDAQVANGGVIQADGGSVLLTARAADVLTRSVVNQTGVIRAQTLASGARGEILLLADMASGTVNAGGRLDASAPTGGDGGFVETSAARVNVQPGVSVTAAAAHGRSGTWLVDPTDIVIDAAAAAGYASTLNTGTSVTVSTASAGTDAGDITINSPIQKTAGGAATLTLRADRNIGVHADITSTSSRLNIVLSSANAAGATAGGIDIDGNLDSNGGRILIGGAGAVTKNALQTVVTSNAIGYALNHTGFNDGTTTVTAAINLRAGRSIVSRGGDIIMNGLTSATASNLSAGLDKAALRFSTGTIASPTRIETGGGNLVLSGVSTASNKVWGISFLGGSTGDLIRIETGATQGHLVLDAVNSIDASAALSMQQAGGFETVMFFMPSVAHLLPLLNGSVDVASFTSSGPANATAFPYVGTLEIPGSNSSYKYAQYNVTRESTVAVYGVYDGTREYDGTTAVPLATMTSSYPRYLNASAGFEADYPSTDLRFATYSKNVGNYNSLAVSYTSLPGVTNPLADVLSGSVKHAVEFFGSYRITPKVITPTATDKVYDGTATATLSAAGLLPADSVTFNAGTAVFSAGKNVGSGLAVTATGMSLTGDDAENYSLASSSLATTASITARAITINSTAGGTKVYGTNDPVSAKGHYAVAAVGGGNLGLATGDTLTGDLGRISGETVGPYDYTQGTMTVADGNGGANYSITFNGSTNRFTITQAPLTARLAVPSQTKVYGSDDPALAGLTVNLSGRVNATVTDINGTSTPIDDRSATQLGATLSGLTRTAGEGVGSRTITGAAFNALTGSASANYSAPVFSTDNSPTLAITPRSLGVSLSSPNQSKVYGDDDPALSGIAMNLTGLVNRTASTWGGPVTVNDSAVTAVAGSLTRSAGEAVGQYAISSGSATLSSSGGNYSQVFSTANSPTLAITPRSLGVSLSSPNQSKVYGDDDPGAAGIGVDLTGLVNRVVSTWGGTVAVDDSAVTAQWSSLTRAPGENVGRYSITTGSATLSASGSNYGQVFSVANDPALFITLRDLTVAARNTTKVYGETDPALDFDITQGTLRNGDSLNGVLVRASGESAGRYVIDASQLANDNYRIVAINGELTITRRPITVLVDDLVKAQGSADPVFSFRITSGSLLGSDSLGSLLRVPGEAPGVYLIDGSSLANGNYDITALAGTLTIRASAAPPVPLPPPPPSPIIVPVFVDNGTTALTSSAPVSFGGLNYISATSVLGGGLGVLGAPQSGALDGAGSVGGALPGPAGTSAAAGAQGSAAGSAGSASGSSTTRGNSSGIESGDRGAAGGGGGGRRSSRDLNVNTVSVPSATGPLDVIVVEGGVNRGGVSTLRSLKD